MPATPPRLHPLHVQNLNHLILLRNALQQDLVTACYEHGVDKKSAKCYRDATDEELLLFAYSVDMSLFVPRFLGDDLCRIIQAPAEIRGIIATANLRGSRQGLPAKDRSRGNEGVRVTVGASDRQP
jgi:hypothetical protein